LLGTTLRLNPGGHDGITLLTEYTHNIYIGYFPSILNYLHLHPSPRRYPYIDVAVGLAWSHNPKSYDGDSVCYW
jgi:hypothetical protein